MMDMEFEASNKPSTSVIEPAINPRIPSGESISNTSNSEDTEESEDTQSEEEEGQRNEETENVQAGSVQATYGEDLLLHSLESDRYGPSVQKYISKYLDDDLNTFLLSKQRTKKEKGDKDGLATNLQHFARTIKAATRHIDAQGKKAAFTRQQSQSMLNLAGDSVTPPTTPNHDDFSQGSLFNNSPSPSTTGIRSVIESQILQEKEAVSPLRQQDMKRKMKKRHVNKLRIQERDAKNSEAEGEGLSNGNVSVELKSQFSCLPSRPIYQSSFRTSNNSLSHNSLKMLSQQAPDCPVERIQFYKSFVQVVRKGKKGGNGFVTNSNNSVPSGGIVELVYKQELRDLIWLEIKGWVNNRPMIDEDSYLCSQRTRIPQTLQNLLKFSVAPQRSRSNSVATANSVAEEVCTSPTAAFNDSRKPSQEMTNSQTSELQNDLRVLIDADTLAASTALKLNIKDASIEKATPDEVPASPERCTSPLVEDDCNCSETLSRICQVCVDKDNQALEQVNSMLAELEDMELLYPCTKALAIDFPAYVSEPLSARMKTLYLYSNITRDMREKIDMLAKLFQIHNREAAGWPNFNTELEDQNESCEATPEIRPDVYGYHYRLSGQAPLLYAPSKQVHFKSATSKDGTNTNQSDNTTSAPESPEAQIPHSPFDNSTSSKGSSGYQSSQHGKENLFFQRTTSIYRRYADKALKHKGLRYIYHHLSHLLRPLLNRVHAALKKPSSYTYAEAVSSNSKLTVATGHNFRSKKSPVVPREYCEELSTYGVWSAPYQQMALPSFHRPFLFLLRVTIDVIHECMRIRLEQLPDQPSAVSVGQLIRECKEVIRAGVQIRQRYVNLSQTVLGEGGSDVVEAQLDSFDDDLKTMLQIYLKYLEQYMFFMSKLSSQTASTLKQKGYLEEEWNFVRTYCPHIPDGEALAANKFCLMASDLLTSIGDYIQNGIDECFATFNESIAAAPQNVSIFRKGVLSSCRKFKSVFQEASGRACQATAFAKTLRKDLEFAAVFRINVDTDFLLVKLLETGHIRVFAPNCSNYVMFIPSYMQGSESYIWQLVDLTCRGRSIETDVDSCGYLLVMACPDREINWQGTTVVLEPTAEATISLSHVQVDGVLFVVNQPSHLEVQCRQFQQLMGGSLKIHKQQTSCNRAIAEALYDLKKEALEVQNKISHSLNLIYDQVDVTRVDNLDEYEMSSLQVRCLDVFHQGFKFAFEYEKALNRLITGDLRANLSENLVSFSLQWIKFVITKCEKGKGFKTRWANQGLLYLMVALEPNHLQALTDLQYAFLKTEVDKFLNHVHNSNEKATKIPTLSPRLNIQGPYSVLIPSQSYKPLASSLNFQRSQSVSSVKGYFGAAMPQLDQLIEQDSKTTRLEEWAQKKHGSNNSLRVSLRKIPEVQHTQEIKPMERVQKAIAALEERRRKRLQEKGAIGDISDVIIQRAPLQIAARKVNFAWQRGFKIGEGRFGKVYTAVNNTTGELIAMKEIHLQPNDHRAVKETIDEIKTFEGIKHKNIVRYFGVEIHREDLYIFMEYCNEGSLESAVQLNLPEQLVRKYTRQLLEAVNVLHENGIVHRDIKSANIFLTSDGNLKLGDFGCCMKLKNQTTMAGELSAFVGTPAYMAPEIFTKNAVEGHGRAVDVWSIGCVVLEMLTGRRPWHDLDNSYQIMFRVGMGETPEIPDAFCGEDRSFIDHCLNHDPRLRWSTGQLLIHPFTKVEDDEAIV